uniref:Uncharacterized protein n=1 Tax=Panagrolaimus sp. JU765 TaxID=591449 RepID=A0AC34QVB3_9BILA
MCCCCCNLHRHQVHLISYGCVAFGLLSTGLIFTIFSIFYKDTQIGKVWLAGPTTMVVGLVLCGKVVIDWGPAMLHAREGSIDSALVQRMGNPVLNQQERLLPEHKTLNTPPTSVKSPTEKPQYRSNGECLRHPRLHSYDGDIGQEGAIDCIIYSQFESPSNSNVSSQDKTSHSRRYKIEDESTPQSPLAPLRAKIGMLRGGSVGTQTSPPPHIGYEITSTGLPIIKPRLMSPIPNGNVSPSFFMFPSTSPNYIPTMNHFSTHHFSNICSPMLHPDQTTFSSNRRLSMEPERRCSCGNRYTVSQNQTHFRTSLGQIQDYGSMQREQHFLPRQQLYQEIVAGTHDKR